MIRNQAVRWTELTSADGRLKLFHCLGCGRWLWKGDDPAEVAVHKWVHWKDGHDRTQAG